MNRLLADRRVRRWGLEGGLVVVAVVLAVFAFRTSGQTGDVAQERENIEKRLASAHGDLGDLRSGAAVANLQQELQRLEATVPPDFPPLMSALEFGTAFTAYAASQQLTLDAFDVASATYDIGGAGRPAISYSIKARGPAGAVVGVLTLPVRFPTSVIQTLELKRDPQSNGEWSLSLTLFVVHSGA